MSTGSVAASYRGLFAEPVLRRLAVADVCARLPQGMISITLLLVAAQHASMAVAGLVVAGYTLGQAVTGPVRGQLADRRGLIPVAVACGAGYALALLALLCGALAQAPAGLVIAAAAVAGLVNPPLSPGMRSLWSTHAGATFRPTAFALDAAVFDLAYITGPVLASALATGIAPAAALGLMLALTGVAVAVIGRQARRPEHPPEQGPRSPRWPVLRSRALRRLLVTAALVNAAISATEVALIAYVRHHHALWASGPLLAGVSIGSILGSLLLGARVPAAGSGSRDRRRRIGPAAGLLRRRAGPAHRGRAVPSAARGGRPAGRVVPRTDAGHPLQRSGQRGTARRRHPDPGLDQLDHERRGGGRRRRGRRCAGRLRGQPSHPRPGSCRCLRLGFGGQRRRHRACTMNRGAQRASFGRKRQRRAGAGPQLWREAHQEVRR